MAVCENTPLQYLFTVLFKDGSSITQTLEDVSVLDPKRPAFFDVQEKMKEVEPKALILESVSGLNKAAVSLEDGHFEIDGSVFFVGDAPDRKTPLRLIYFRRNYRDFKMGMDMQTEQVAHHIHYYFGWQTTTEEGENIQRTIGIL